jgi:formylglycine-generating enzyme required for sulfatase activity
MRKTLIFVTLIGIAAHSTIAAATVETEAQELAMGQELLKQRRYLEAYTAFRAVLQNNPANAMAHFYLADYCLSTKTWGCAETHYKTLLELDAQSSVASLAKQRVRKAKVWRLLEEGKLGLDDDQQALYQQLPENVLQEHKQSQKNMVLAQPQEMSMAVVPSGEFIMGSLSGAANEQPQHLVYVDTFFMDKYEVSVGEYAKFLEATSLEAPHDWTIMNQPQHEKRPVVNIDWADAATYCKWVGKRLPTEAEWEKAARGTDGRIYPWGNEPPTRLRASFVKEKWNEYAAFAPVGTLEDGKSPYGIYDMAGNVWEWVSDWYGRDYYKNGPLQNPKGPSSGEFKVIRGGSSYYEVDLRSASRLFNSPSHPSIYYGFRCAKTP